MLGTFEELCKRFEEQRQGREMGNANLQALLLTLQQPALSQASPQAPTRAGYGQHPLLRSLSPPMPPGSPSPCSCRDLSGPGPHSPHPAGDAEGPCRRGHHETSAGTHLPLEELARTLVCVPSSMGVCHPPAVVSGRRHGAMLYSCHQPKEVLIKKCQVLKTPVTLGCSWGSAEKRSEILQKSMRVSPCDPNQSRYGVRNFLLSSQRQYFT